MTNLNVALRAPGDSPSGGIVRAIPRTENRVVSGGGAIRHDGYSIRLNSGNGSQTGIGVLNFPADEFQEVEWSFEVHWDSTNKTVTFGPYTYGQISAAGVDSLDDLIGTEVLEYVATSTVIQRLEALEAGGGGGGGGPVAWVDITGKPSTFPPATHGHPWSEITSKPTTFTPSAHTHGAGDLTGVVKTVNGTAPDSSGNVVVSGGGGGGGGPLTGTGFPEGNVSATPGTEYIDTAATNGAIKWIKVTGTGNTGWRVTEGDTGPRRINSASLTDGWMVIQRIGPHVHISFKGGLYGTVQVANTGQQWIITEIPEGFGASIAYIEACSRDGADPNGFVVITEGLVILRGLQHANLIRPGICTHPAAPDVPWPAGDLPGVPDPS